MREQRLESETKRAVEHTKKTGLHHGLPAQETDHPFVGHLLGRIVDVAVLATTRSHPAHQRTGDAEGEVDHCLTASVCRLKMASRFSRSLSYSSIRNMRLPTPMRLSITTRSHCLPISH